MAPGRIGLGFSRQENGFDVTLPLDVAGATSKSPRDFQAFQQCIKTMAERAKAKLGGDTR